MTWSSSPSLGECLSRPLRGWIDMSSLSSVERARPAVRDISPTDTDVSAALHRGMRAAGVRVRMPPMTRFVIGPDVALHLAAERAVVSADHQLVAPALLRSQVLTLLYEAVARGELSRK